MLKLAQLTFPHIGALAETSPGIYQVMERHFTMNMANMVKLTNASKTIFPPSGTTYQIADE